MNIRVSPSAEQLEINLGACRAKLNPAQALALRDELAEVLLSALNESPNYWQSLIARLDKLNYLAEALHNLDDEQLLEVIKTSHQPHWLILVRFARKAHPELAKRLLATIGQLSSQAFTSLEEFTDQLYLEPASSLAEVVAALEKLEPLLEGYCERPLAKQQTQCEIQKPSFNARAITFLTQLSDLPTSNLRLILKGLSGKELGLLFSACKMLEVNNFFTQLKGILPEKLFMQLENQCAPEIEEAELRNLLSKLNLQLKELKKLLENRKTARQC